MIKYHIMVFLSERYMQPTDKFYGQYGPKVHVASFSGFTGVTAALQWFWDLREEVGEDYSHLSCDVRPYWAKGYKKMATPRGWCHFGDDVIQVRSKRDCRAVKLMCEREMEIQPAGWPRHYFEES